MTRTNRLDARVNAHLSPPSTSGFPGASDELAGETTSDEPPSPCTPTSRSQMKDGQNARSPLKFRLSRTLLSVFLFLSVVVSLVPSVQCAVTPKFDSSFEYELLAKRQATAASSESTCSCHKEEKHDATFAVQAAMIPVLVLLSGAFAGLTLGYMSLDATQLSVLSKSGSQRQRELAAKILPLRKDGHLLLITLLIANMICNEILPVVSDPILGGGAQAVVVSTVLIVVFAEIIPQSVCSRFGLQVGAYAVWPVQCLVFLFYPISWPIARLLNRILGPHAGVIYRRAELKELVQFHGQTNEHGGDLDRDVVTIVGATLDLQEKRVRDAMTPISKCFMLNVDDRLTFETLGRVLQSGHSRIPVYEEIPSRCSKGIETSRRKILGVLLTKNLILIDPEDGVPLREYPLHPLPIVSDIMPLLNILNSFQEGRSHMAIVCPRKAGYYNDRNVSGDGPDSPASDTVEGTALFFRKTRTNSISSRKSGKSSKSAKSPSADKAEKGDLDSAPNALQAPLEEDMPMGIITLEDVIEELLGEEIYDETDQTPFGNTAVRPFVPPEAEEAIRNVKRGLLTNGKAKNPSHVASPPTTITSPSKAAACVSPPPGMLKTAAAKLSFVGGMGRSRSAPGKTRSGAPVVIAPVGNRGHAASPKQDQLASVPGTERLANTADNTIPADSTSKGNRYFNEGHPVVEVPIRTGTPLASPMPSMQNDITSPTRAVSPRLSQAILIERGRRALVRQGVDPNDMAPLRLPLPTSSTAGQGLPVSGCGLPPPDTNLGPSNSTISVSAPPGRGAFKLPARVLAVPIRTGSTPVPTSGSRGTALGATQSDSAVMDSRTMSPTEDRSGVTPAPIFSSRGGSALGVTQSDSAVLNSLVMSPTEFEEAKHV